MKVFALLAFAAVASRGGYASFHSTGNAASSSTLREYDEPSLRVTSYQGSEGRSFFLVDNEPLWILPWEPPARHSGELAASVSRLTTDLNDTTETVPFSGDPPGFMKKILDLEAALVSLELKRAEAEDDGDLRDEGGDALDVF